MLIMAVFTTAKDVMPVKHTGHSWVMQDESWLWLGQC